jgi:N-acetylmuramoyl-L-alanine amidase
MKMKSPLSSLIPIYSIILIAIFVITVTGNRAFTVFSESNITDARRCVIIDPGHGGVDGGAISCTGTPESHINLDIALRLNDLLQLLGIKTIMIRTTDCSIHTDSSSIASKKVSDLKNRVSIINNTENPLLISIHQNYFPDSRYSGAQVFFGKGEGSATLAKNLQTAFVNALNPGSNRKAKKASGIYLMENIKCTGVLIECGFISNLREEQLLLDKDYQKKLCCVIASECSMYLYGTDA